MVISLEQADLYLKENGFDIHRKTDRLGMEIEPEIKPLVLALNYRGYETSMSCGGHTLIERENRMQYRINDGTGELVFRAERGLVYKINDKFGERTHVFNESPWVHIESPRKGMDDFAKFIQNHNSLGIIWNFEKLQGSETFRLETSPRYDLMQMRQDSEDLAYEILGSEKI